jgi:hypothetical protein
MTNGISAILAGVLLLAGCAIEKKQMVATVVVSNDTPFGRTRELVSLGLPLKPGMAPQASWLELYTGNKQPEPFQAVPTAWWPDSSVKAVNLAFTASVYKAGFKYWFLATGPVPAAPVNPGWIKNTGRCWDFQLEPGAAQADFGETTAVALTGSGQSLHFRLAGRKFQALKKWDGDCYCRLADTSAAGNREWIFYRNQSQVTGRGGTEAAGDAEIEFSEEVRLRYQDNGDTAASFRLTSPEDTALLGAGVRAGWLGGGCRAGPDHPPGIPGCRGLAGPDRFLKTPAVFYRHARILCIIRYASRYCRGPGPFGR